MLFHEFGRVSSDFIRFKECIKSENIDVGYEEEIDWVDWEHVGMDKKLVSIAE